MPRKVKKYVLSKYASLLLLGVIFNPYTLENKKQGIMLNINKSYKEGYTNDCSVPHYFLEINIAVFIYDLI